LPPTGGLGFLYHEFFPITALAIQGVQYNEIDKAMVGDARFWMCSYFHSHGHMPNVSKQDVRNIDQLLMPKVVQQWKVVIEHNCCHSLTSNVLDEVEGNINPCMGE